MMLSIKKSCIVFKADFDKACVTRLTGSIFIMMGKLGFNFKWTKWIKSCLESSMVSVLVNGNPTQEKLR